MNFLIENHKSDDPEKMALAAQLLGHKVFYEKYIPFGGMSYDFLPKNEPVVCLGTIGMIKHAQANIPGHTIGIWCDWKELRCQNYYTKYGEHLLQEKYIMMPLGEIERLAEYVAFLISDEVFIRPDENNKEFTGEVINLGKLKQWRQSLACEPFDECLCVIAPPQNILREYRLVIADGKCVAGSIYRENGMIAHSPDLPEDLIVFAEKLAGVYSPHPIFVMDVAAMEDGYKLIEIGSANCAGFYKAELSKVIAAMSDIAEREWNELIY